MGPQRSGQASKGHDEESRLQRSAAERFGEEVSNPEVHQQAGQEEVSREIRTER